MVEIVATMVIMVVVAAYAIPRMMGSNDVAAKVTADRVLAALHFAQTLAQRQGVATSAVIETTPNNHLAVNQGGFPVSFPTQNYDGTTRDVYDALLHPTVTFVPVSAVIAYGADGIPSPVSSYSVTVKGNDGMSFKIKAEPTGFAHFE